MPSLWVCQHQLLRYRCAFGVITLSLFQRCVLLSKRAVCSYALGSRLAGQSFLDMGTCTLMLAFQLKEKATQEGTKLFLHKEVS